MSTHEFPPAGPIAPGPGPLPPQYSPRPRNQLSKLVWVLLVAVVILALPYLVEQIEFAITRGRERAEAEVARTQLAKLTDTSEAFRLVAKSVGPAVVHIDTRGAVAPDGDERFFFFGQPRQILQGQGSGVIVDTAGYIVTNYHVIAQADHVSVTLSDGRAIASVRLVGADPLTDLAVLKISARGLVAAPWGDSRKLQVGDWVLAIGDPYGLDRSVTSGIISAKDRSQVTNKPYQSFLQTDAAVNPGNSGGPLVNLQGQIVGINTAILGQVYQGISFAIPSEIAEDVYGRLKKTGKATWGWLGIGMQKLTPELAAQLGIAEPRGALVSDVRNGTPAQEAGFKAGDVVVAWNGQAVVGPSDLALAIARSAVGDKAKVVIVREGKEKTVEVTVGERPANAER
jgi:serine protease Do